MNAMQRRIVIVIYEGFQFLDLAGPADVFATAAMLAGDSGYALEVAAPHAGEVTAHNGVTVAARTALADIAGPVDTLMIVGGLGTGQHLGDHELTAQIARLAHESRRVTSVCSGALLLAECGLLDGRRATTHWLVADQLSARYPQVEVDADPIYIKDGDVWTSAGVTAGIDLALALVAEDHGHALARDVACGLVVYLHRPGGQSQFSTPLNAQTPPSHSLRDLQAYIDAHPEDDLTVPALARRAGMSERHFSRVFTQQTGIPPGRYVERSRADAARRLLEATTHPLPTIARRTGLGAPETLYRVFRRHWRISPGDYRRRFQSKAP
ncbi:GlxA family transcriptional regulator [Sphaerisporangium aureirubrum]|uniref:GlxA family transcriptional regulator n=1 Tax=Sphaerisporangium aureirubrum TaxID=1544736 RepID=A0ABW1NUK4_9ACTN